MRNRVIAVISFLFLSSIGLGFGYGRASADAPLAFEGSGLDAGGFQSVVAVNPFDSGTILSGADVAGISRSTDGGDEWFASNGGITNKQLLQVASLAYSPGTPGKVYAALGKAGGSGGFGVSTNGGLSWEIRSTAVKFAGGNTDGPLPSPHPRSTGNLIALDESNGYIYAGTYKDGVYRSGDDGYTWTYLGLSGQYIRGIALNPDDAGELFVAAYGEKLYRTDNADGSSLAWTQIANSPLDLEELRYIGNTLYAVGSDGSAGKVYELAGSSLAELLSTSGDTVYTSIDGYSTGGANTIFIGATNPKANGSLYESVLRSDDGGATWTPLTVDASGIHYEMGTSSNVWWLSQLNPDAMIGKTRFVAAYIQVDPNNHNRLYVSGRSGVWKGDIDESTGDVDWHPIVRNLNVTFNQSVLADPSPASPWRVYVGSTDWGFLYSTNSLTDVHANRPSGVSDGYALAADTSTSPTTVYVGTGSGDVLSNVNPVHPDVAGWNSEDLSAATGGGEVIGLAVQQVSGTRTILAAVAGKGIWRKSGSNWSNMLSSSSALGAQTTNKAAISWPAGSSYVYLYDRESGVWRSDNNGAAGSWTKIWNHPSAATGPAKSSVSYVAADPADTDTLYVSAHDGLFKLTGARTGTVEGGGISKIQLTAVSDPGPLAFSADGNLYVATLYGSGTTARLYLSTDGGASFTDIADDYYHGNAGFPIDLSAGGNGKIYVSLNGQGILVGG
ncbi:hypothetical protein [Cohnella zeiphila]|uniref:Xyloglucanase n=1 Tax=Cohnella zeiphila TaxID=2761120 RepID=A0A7X0SPI1_9BACL|nr:hypothetical protein [Cohnella zeiphila]MBB6733631.1 hypothetical protein [Cohnella zeiphila]